MYCTLDADELVLGNPRPDGHLDYLVSPVDSDESAMRAQCTGSEIRKVRKEVRKV